jgi:hypothetical protein
MIFLLRPELRPEFENYEFLGKNSLKQLEIIKNILWGMNKSKNNFYKFFQHDFLVEAYKLRPKFENYDYLGKNFWKQLEIIQNIFWGMNKSKNNFYEFFEHDFLVESRVEARV